ncbi:MAG: SHOCT domain-containing protein [Bacillota bacterium]
MFIMPILWIVVLVAIVVFAGQFFSRPFGNLHNARHLETPLEILKRRYASGEISKTEFEAMKRDLAD